MKEPIIYSQLRNNFSQVSNRVLLDTRLSSKAKTLYWYMCYRLGLSDSWQFNTSEILKHFKEGDKAMRSAFKELIDTGFLERKRIRNDKGIFTRTDYTIYAEPINTGSDPQVQNRRVDKRRVDKPHVDNAAHNNKEGSNKELNKKDFISLPSEAKREILQKIWKEKGLKSNCEKYFLYRDRVNWKGVSNVEADIAWWEDGYLEKNPDAKPLPPPAGNNISGEKPEIYDLRSEIKSLLCRKVDQDWQLGFDVYVKFFAQANIKKSGFGYIIFVEDKKALEYQELLAQINVKIEVKK